jgi:hypothetical protein
MQTLKTFKASDVRKFNPCYDPIVHLAGEDAEITVVDAFQLTALPFNEKIWLLLKFSGEKFQILLAAYFTTFNIAGDIESEYAKQVRNAFNKYNTETSPELKKHHSSEIKSLAFAAKPILEENATVQLPVIIQLINDALAADAFYD